MLKLFKLENLETTLHSPRNDHPNGNLHKVQSGVTYKAARCKQTQQ